MFWFRNGAIRLEKKWKERRMDRKERRRGKVREAVTRETALGPRCASAGIPAVRCTRRHLLRAKQLGHVGERQDKELDAKRETREEEQGEGEEREGEEVWLSVRAVTRRGKRRFG